MKQLISDYESDVLVKSLNIKPSTSNRKIIRYEGGPAMTVQEVIDCLSQVDDKSLPVFADGFVPVVSVNNSDNFILIKSFSY